MAKLIRWLLMPMLSLLILTAACAGASPRDPSSLPVPPGHAQVADILPHHDGLQFCADIRARDLAPRNARDVHIHSLSAFITTSDPTQFALLAITGRYPGWDTPGTSIYNQQYSNTNTVWLEILHEFHLGMACIEVYGRGLRPSKYALFRDKILVAFSYRPIHGPGRVTQKLIPIHWGRYLPRYSPRVRPRH